MPNAVHNLDTKLFQNATGEFPAIIMGLDIPNADDAASFLDRVIERWKTHRMCSPPNTANMTITLTGDVTARQFCELWRKHATRDPILHHFTAKMVVADVLHIAGRKLLDRASLLPDGEKD